jgi:uncharacterized membrane protein
MLISAGAAWTALVVAAPLFGWSAVYTAAHLVCHQIPGRSFHLGAGPLAVCARCLGLYLGALAGGAAALAPAVRPSRSTTGVSARWTLAAFAVPTALTLAAEWSGWSVGNPLRFAAALPLGAAAAWLVVRALEVDWRA